MFLPKRDSVWSIVLIAMSAVGSASAGKPVSQPPAAPVLYRIQWLNALGGTSTQARDINSFGEVVGWGYTASGRQTAFLWTSEDGTIALESLVADWRLYNAEAINDHGQIVGMGLQLSTGKYGGFLYSPAYVNSEGIWIEPRVELLPALPGNDGLSPAGINNLGEVCGESFGGSSSSYHEVVYRPGDGVIDLGVSNGSDNLRSEINDSGEVVGTHITGGKYYTYLYRPEVGVKLYSLNANRTGYFACWGTAINNAGDFVGGCNDPNSKSTGLVPYKYPAGGSVKLLTTAGGKSFAINNNGQTVGDLGLDGFLHTDANGCWNLDSLIDPKDEQRGAWLSAWSVHAEDVADAPAGAFGKICGTATFQDATGAITGTSSYVLVPVTP